MNTTLNWLVEFLLAADDTPARLICECEGPPFDSTKHEFRGPMPDVEGMRIAFIVFPGYFISPPLRILSKPLVQVERLAHAAFSSHRPWWRTLPRRPKVAAIMILVAVLTGLLGWEGWALHIARLRLDAVAAIWSGGGQVQYDWQLRYLRDMTHLEFLILPKNISVTDATLSDLSRLTALSSLELHDRRITDAGLASLKDMTKLKNLVLSGTQASGAGLEYLGAMTDLRQLDLSRTDVDDLEPIRHLTLLSNLRLSQTIIDDKGSGTLTALTALTRVELDDTRITDVTLAHLSGLSNLQSLSIATKSPMSVSPT